MINITDEAREAILESLASDGLDPTSNYLRVGVKGGGCSGLSYQLAFDTDLKDDDEVFSSGNARIVVDNKSMLFLHGLTLHHTKGLNGKGFEFQNPNAQGTCGCGQSFKV
ncbi:MAG TPA: iron-sulfur cluster assembly accessory protein [Candidatus Krumholzibacteria bacterium]|nr:iron-sulfur cluster assembly accessory protein [Candidatus Krumholzibacteria bacterium]